MRSVIVVAASPLLDDHPGLGQACKDLSIQTLTAERAVEPFLAGILPWPPRIDIGQCDAAAVLFLIIGSAVTNLLYLSYDEQAFAGEFGLYPFGLLPFLTVLAVSGAWSAIQLLRRPDVTKGFKLMSATTLAFVAAGMFGSLFDVFPPAWPYIVVGYLSASMLMALFWFGFRRRHDRD